MEGTTVVHELLDVLLEEAVLSSKWDVTVIGKDQNKRKRVAAPSILAEPPTAVCQLVREHCQDEILVNYSMRGCKQTELLQLKCLEQRASGYCGYYALYFVICLLEMCQATNKTDMLGYLSQVTSAGAFWRRYWWSVTQLLERVEAEGGEWWPWTREYVMAGDMERSFLRHLLSTDDHLEAMAAQAKVLVIQYAYGRVQNSFSDVCVMQDKIEAFVSSTGPNYLIFILGVTNHWVVLLANKSQPVGDSAHSEVGLLYLDSNNIPVLTYCDSDFEQRVLENERERIATTGLGYTDWKREVYQQAYKDQKNLVMKLAEYVNSHGSMCLDILEDFSSHLLNSYDINVTKQFEVVGDTDLLIPLVLRWCELHYPPQVLRENLLPMVDWAISSELSTNVLMNLKGWAESLCVQLLALQPTEIPSIDKLQEFLTDIIQRLN